MSPSPPPDFLEPPASWLTTYRLNLTDGAISDDTAARWFLGDLRRAMGDGWAIRHLRMDLVNAGVLGSVGMTGDDQFIAREQARGTVEILRDQTSDELVAIGVIAIAPELRRRYPELTEFVIVTMWRGTGNGSVRVLRDGRREPIPVRPAGTLVWQLDAGGFTNDPVVGPLWYQAQGWVCQPDSPGLGPLCGMVRPPP